MVFHHYRPLKNPRVDEKRWKRGLKEDEEFEIALSGWACLMVSLGGSFLDAILTTPVANCARKKLAGEPLNFEGKLRWLFRGRIRHFVLWGPSLCLQSLSVGSTIRAHKGFINKALTPTEYLTTTYWGGFFSALYSAPVDFLRAKQKVSRKYLLQISRDTFHSAGLLGFYRDFRWCVLRDSIYCFSWLGAIPAFYVLAANKSETCKNHPAITSVPACLLMGALCSPLYGLTSAKETALQFSPELERASVQYQFNQLYKSGALRRSLEYSGARYALSFFLLDRIRMRTVNFRTDRKLKAHPYLVHAGLFVPDAAHGVHYRYVDENDKMFK